MNVTALERTDFFHDAEVYKIGVSIGESGNRQLELQLRCDSDCGYESWNDKRFSIVFANPVIILADLLGHVANVEMLNGWDLRGAQRIRERIKRLTKSGLPSPKHVASITFHSGSTLDVAFDHIHMTPVE